MKIFSKPGDPCESRKRHEDHVSVQTVLNDGTNELYLTADLEAVWHN